MPRAESLTSPSPFPGGEMRDSIPGICGGPTTRWSPLRFAPGIFDRPGQLGRLRLRDTRPRAGRAAPPQGCSPNLEAVRRLQGQLWSI